MKEIIDEYIEDLKTGNLDNIKTLTITTGFISNKNTKNVKSFKLEYLPKHKRSKNEKK